MCVVNEKPAYHCYKVDKKKIFYIANIKSRFINTQT